MVESNGKSVELAVFGGGCFWCTEAVFSMVKGIIAVTPGYTGGVVRRPTYEEVVTGKTGHVEAVRIQFNPSLITYDDLLTIFFNTHDPTTLNKQGADVGEHYRSVIFYADEEQKRKSENIIRELTEAHAYDNRIVTEVLPLGEFYEAEDYHRKYYEQHKGAPYCELVIEPKLEKMRKRFAELLNHTLLFFVLFL